VPGVPEQEIIDFFYKYEYDIHWRVVTMNDGFDFPSDIIMRQKQECNWNFLSRSGSLNWSEELIENLKHYLVWGDKNSVGLSGNEFLPWSIELIDKYRDFWNWSFLSQNKSLPWSEELIDEFFSYWDWYRLSANPSLPFTVKFIDKYYNHFSPSYLAENEGVFVNTLQFWGEDEINGILQKK
jgi:hypothetical protein